LWFLNQHVLVNSFLAALIVCYHEIFWADVWNNSELLNLTVLVIIIITSLGDECVMNLNFEVVELVTCNGFWAWWVEVTTWRDQTKYKEKLVLWGLWNIVDYLSSLLALHWDSFFL
jgi:hypothetical protein